MPLDPWRPTVRSGLRSAAAASALSPDHFCRRLDPRQPRDARQLRRNSLGGGGIGPNTIGVLWSMSVAAEVVVFLFIGRPLLDRIGPAHAAMIAAAAGLRWVIMAETTWLPALAAIQPLHGLTFALLHLTCMRLLAQCAPRHLEATALTVYGTVGIGLPTALLIIGSGQLYSHFGAKGFFVMAALCAVAVPFARTLREPN